MGPSDCCSSERPMHWPELAPVQGMLSTEGSPPGEDWNSGEFGTMSGVQTPVKVSSVSPLGHAATDGPAAAGTVKAATAGAAAIATANPPARTSRRRENSRVAIVTLSVVIDRVVGRILWNLPGICTGSESSLRTRRFTVRRA